MALTGIMKAFEDSTGKPLDEKKKELATEELIITGDLGEDIGADKATGVVNDIKTEIIKNNTSDTTQIADTINNITNSYNISLTPEQKQQLEDFMSKIAKQNYDYDKMKNTLDGIKDTVNDKLNELGEAPKEGFFASIKNWFSNSFGGDKNKDLGILEHTDDSILGNNAIIDATDEKAINLPSSDEVEGIFAKIKHWFTSLFGNNSDMNNDNSSNSNNNSDENNIDQSVESLEENSTTDTNVQPDSSQN